MNGFGRVINLADGGYYIGMWKNHKMHGYGKRVYKNGNIAEGYWVDNQFKG